MCTSITQTPGRSHVDRFTETICVFPMGFQLQWFSNPCLNCRGKWSVLTCRIYFSTIDSFSKSRYRSNSRYFYRNFKNSVKSTRFYAIPAEIALVVTFFFLNSRYSSATGFGCFFGQSIALCRHDWASFGLWGFEKNETSSFCPWIWWFLPTFSVSADIDVRPCSVVKRPKGHSHLKQLQPSHIGCEFNRPFSKLLSGYE